MSTMGFRVSTSSRALLTAFGLLLVATPARAQTGGLYCSACGGATTLPLFVCQNFEHILTAGQCGTGYENCQPPQVSPAFVEAIPTGSDTFEARLVVETVAPYNSTISNPNNRVTIYWSAGSVPMPGADSCSWPNGDRIYTYLAKDFLTCSGAPYDFGTYDDVNLSSSFPRRVGRGRCWEC